MRGEIAGCDMQHLKKLQDGLGKHGPEKAFCDEELTNPKWHFTVSWHVAHVALFTAVHCCHIVSFKMCLEMEIDEIDSTWKKTKKVKKGERTSPILTTKKSRVSKRFET